MASIYFLVRDEQNEIQQEKGETNLRFGGKFKCANKFKWLQFQKMSPYFSGTALSFLKKIKLTCHIIFFSFFHQTCSFTQIFARILLFARDMNQHGEKKKNLEMPTIFRTCEQFGLDWQVTWLRTICTPGKIERQHQK